MFRKPLLLFLIIAVLWLMSGFSASALNITNKIIEVKDNLVNTATNFKSLNTNSTQNLLNASKRLLNTAENAYENAKSSWLRAKETYKKANINLNLESALSKAKIFLERSIEVIIRHQEFLKKKVEAIQGEIEGVDKSELIKSIDEDIAWYNAKKAEISSISTRDELKTFSRELREHWSEQTIENRRIAGYLMVRVAQRIYNKVLAIGEKFHDKIESLAAEGYDVSELENKYNDYLSQMSLAKEKFLAALEKFKTMDKNNWQSLFKDGKSLLKESGDYFKQARTILREILVELKAKLKFKSVSGTGSIFIQGSGTANIRGNGEVNIQANGSGEVLVVDRAGDVEVNTHGQGTKEIINDSKTQYTGVGEMDVQGSDMTVRISGTNLVITATGSGRATMVGSGTYKTSNASAANTLPKEGIKINFTPSNDTNNQ